MRNSVRTPLVKPTDGEAFHVGIVSAAADALPNWQRTLFGTMAYHAAYGRRSNIESVNSQIHDATGALTEVSRGYTKHIDTGRITIFMVHTIAGYNHRTIQNWISDHRPEVLKFREDRKKAGPRAPRKKRLHRYDDLPPFYATSPPVTNEHLRRTRHPFGAILSRPSACPGVRRK
jgi:hypothetical protein